MLWRFWKKSTATPPAPPPPPVGRRAPSDAISERVFTDLKLSGIQGGRVEVTHDLSVSLVNMRIQAMSRTALALGAVTVNFEEMAWDGVKSGTSVASGEICGDDDDPTASVREQLSASQLDFILDSPDLLTELPSPALSRFPRKVRRIAQFLRRLWEKAKKKIEDHPVLRRLQRLAGVTMTVVLAWVKKVLINADVLQQLIPFWGIIKDGIDVAIEAKHAWDHKTSLDDIKAAAGSFGSGVPTIAFSAFERYVNTQMIMSVGSAAWAAAKGLTNALLTIFTMGISNIVSLVTSCVETVVSTAYRLCQAFIFNHAARNIAEKYNAGSVGLVQLNMGDLCGGCPYIGALYLAVSDFIGPDSLVASIAKKSSITASEMYLCRQQIAKLKDKSVDYINDGRFKLKLRGGVDIPEDLRLALQPIVTR